MKCKICFIGEAGVGKSTLVSLLQGRVNRARQPKTKPTIGLSIEESVIADNKCTIWDLGGQKRFKPMWDDFVRNSGLAVLVCDSTKENVEKTKKLYDRYSRHIGAKVIAIANKQDIPGALKAGVVQKKLGGISTYEMSAIKPELRKRMEDILEYELDSD